MAKHGNHEAASLPDRKVIEFHCLRTDTGYAGLSSNKRKRGCGVAASGIPEDLMMNAMQVTTTWKTARNTTYLGLWKDIAKTVTVL